jgi:peptidyl-dipeptidase Dcp
LTADAFGAFVEAGGPYDKKVAERLRNISSQWAIRSIRRKAIAASAAVTPSIEALMKKRGFGG